MNANPTVSVIMSVFNAAEFLRGAINSILNQTFKDFEFIIVDDGSTDATPSILKEFSDPRLKIITQANQGLTKTLNTMIKLAKGVYIARLDADDESEPDRLEQQINFFRLNPDVCLLGTWATFIDKDGQPGKIYQTPVSHSAIKRNIIFHNPFIHPSVMFRKNLISKFGLYNEQYKYAQDYELWSRLVFHTETANLPIPLLRYRVLAGGITKKNNLTVRWIGLKIRLNILLRYLRLKA